MSDYFHKIKVSKIDASNLKLVDIDTNKMAADFRKMHPQIEVVIQIDKEMYKEIAEFNEAALNHSNPLDRLIYRIKNGTVLPEGHGDLKDVSKINYQAGVFVGSEGPLPVIHKIATIEMIRDWLPTIVAADVESEGESK